MRNKNSWFIQYTLEVKFEWDCRDFNHQILDHSMIKLR